MADAFIGEVRTTAFNFAPKYWALCNGQALPIAQNQALFSILGTTYGGNGTTTFQLPNLQARAPIGWGNGQGLPSVTIGQNGGEAAHTLSLGEMASHQHTAMGSSATGAATLPAGALLAVSGGNVGTYLQGAPGTSLIAGTVGMSAGGGSHDNMQPYQVVNFIICLQGIFPSRN